MHLLNFLQTWKKNWKITIYIRWTLVTHPPHFRHCIKLAILINITHDVIWKTFIIIICFLKKQDILLIDVIEIF